TDFPSANLLVAFGIRRIVLVQESNREPKVDLSHTLRRWQEAGLAIFSVGLDGPVLPRPIVVDRPSAFRLVWYNILAKLGLRASPLGGFGGRLPLQSSG